MADYTDSTGRQWRLRLTLASGMRVKDETGIDLQDPKSLGLVADPAALAKVCYILAGAPDDFVSFADAIDGETIESMEAALLKEIENFYPPRKRETFKMLMAKGKEVQELATKQAAEAMQSVTAEAVLKMFASGNSATKSADTLEPTPNE